MAREVTVNAWCDVCLAGGERNPSTPVVLAFNEGASKMVDLCEAHTAQFVTPLQEVWVTHGTAPEQPEPKKGRSPAMPKKHGNYPCLLCKDATFNSNYTFTQHLANVHGTGPQDLFGTTCPACGSSFKSAAGMGSHVAREHADKGTTTADVFKTIAVEGDTYGIVAQRKTEFAKKDAA